MVLWRHFKGDEKDARRQFPEYNQAHHTNYNTDDDDETETEAEAEDDADLSLIGKFLDNHWTSPARAHTDQRSKYVAKGWLIVASRRARTHARTPL